MYSIDPRQIIGSAPKEEKRWGVLFFKVFPNTANLSLPSYLVDIYYINTMVNRYLMRESAIHWSYNWNNIHRYLCWNTGALIRQQNNNEVVRYTTTHNKCSFSICVPKHGTLTLYYESVFMAYIMRWFRWTQPACPPPLRGYHLF